MPYFLFWCGLFPIILACFLFPASGYSNSHKVDSARTVKKIKFYIKWEKKNGNWSGKLQTSVKKYDQKGREIFSKSKRSSYKKFYVYEDDKLRYVIGKKRPLKKFMFQFKRNIQSPKNAPKLDTVVVTRHDLDGNAISFRNSQGGVTESKIVDGFVRVQITYRPNGTIKEKERYILEKDKLVQSITNHYNEEGHLEYVMIEELTAYVFNANGDWEQRQVTTKHEVVHHPKHNRYDKPILVIRKIKYY
ncbi:hypothetical protein KFE98_01220 [bacterium SCSIO 12741]|nr:hypothetical protein KFE98_01220 [bacterium SCSIO 12741]